MFKSLIFFVRFFLLWLLFFAIDRFIFMFIFHKKLRDIPFSEKLAAFYHAIPLDLSTTAYISIFPVLVYLLWYFSSKKLLNTKLISLYNAVIIVLISIISVANFNIYREWGYKINARVIEFAVLTPSESIASSGSSPIYLTLFILFILIITGLYLNFVIINRKVEKNNRALKSKIVICIATLFIVFLIIRGGFWSRPIAQSRIYFSNHQILNHASLNTTWNLFSSLIVTNDAHKNPYQFWPDQDAKAVVNDLYAVKKDTTISILNNTKPNIVIFLLESFTADLTKSLGNLNGVTPTLDSLAKNGILFSNVYATGNRTDKGLIGTLAGYPSLAVGSIVKWPEKMENTPAISKSLYQNGYQTSFYYGGEANFDNYNKFILSHDYKTLVDRNSFKPSEQLSQWGVYDGLVFNKQLADAKLMRQPFFSTILSLTNHEPFEVPGKYKFGKANNAQRFKSTAAYTDSCINAYLTEAKKQSWYKNTLFVFIADHGHLLPKNEREIYEPQRYHIPLIFYGDVLKPTFKGKNFAQVASQQDLAATLLAQLKINSKEFKFSKNLLNPYSKHFAYFSWDNGFGFILNNQTITFDNFGKNVLYNSNPKDLNNTNNLVKKGKAYLQTAYQDFINL